MRISLVLGSGGARGYAHIGVIQELKERGHAVSGIAGTSAGALVGGLEAAGVLPEFEQWARTLTRRDVIRLLDPSITGPGMIKADRLVGHVSRMLQGAQIEDLPIPFTAVATDLTARREVWFQSGPLDRAIRASIAIPGMITPAIVGGRVMVDGGVLNPVPLEPAAAYPADLVVAVALSGPPLAVDGARPVVASAQPGPVGELISRVRDGVSSLTQNDAARSLLARIGGTPGTPPEDDGEALEPMVVRLRTADVLAQSLEAMEAMIERFRSAARPADVTIEVPADACGAWDYHRADEVITVGRDLAHTAFDRAGI